MRTRKRHDQGGPQGSSSDSSRMLHAVVPKRSKRGEAASSAACFDPNVISEPWPSGRFAKTPRGECDADQWEKRYWNIIRRGPVARLAISDLAHVFGCSGNASDRAGRRTGYFAGPHRGCPFTHGRRGCVSESG